MGVADAAQGDLCVPETIFTHPNDKRDYCAGYESISGPTLTTQQFLAPRMAACGRIWEGEIIIVTEEDAWRKTIEHEMRVDDTMEDAELAALADDYADDIKDRTFWAHVC